MQFHFFKTHLIKDLLIDGEIENVLDSIKPIM